MMKKNKFGIHTDRKGSIAPLNPNDRPVVIAA